MTSPRMTKSRRFPLDDFYQHQTHRWALRGFADRSRIGGIILLPLH